MTPLSQGFWIYPTIELEGSMTVEEAENFLVARVKQRREKIHGIYKFCSVITNKYGIMFWRRDRNFDISNHVKEHPVIADSKEHLEKIVSEYITIDVQVDRPPWYAILIHTKWGNTILLFIIHHSITDGVGCMALINLVLADKPAALPQPKSTTMNSLSQNVAICWAYLLTLVGNYAAHGPKIQKTFISTHIRQTAMLKCTEPLQIQDIAAVRKYIPNTTLNDILCGLIMYSVIQYMKTQGIEKKDQDFELYIAASTRTATQLNEIGNHFSKMMLLHPILENLSLRDHIRLFSQLCNKQKMVSPYVYSRTLRCLLGVASVDVEMVKRLLSKYLERSSIVITNRSGPSTAIKVMDRNVKDIILLPHCKVTPGLVVGLSSYNGQVRVALSDKIGVISDSQADHLLQLITTNFYDLVESTRTHS